VPRIYRPRHPERTVLYRVLFHHFEQFLIEYERRFEREYGYFRPVVREVVERYLDCGNPRSGFARIRCPDCHGEHLLTFSCKTRGFCPSCHAKRLEEWGEWVRETLLLDVPHRQVVLTIPKTLRMAHPGVGREDSLLAANKIQRPQPELTFVAEKPPPVHVFETVALAAAEESEVYE
jgi:ribosomal protein S27E